MRSLLSLHSATRQGRALLAVLLLVGTAFFGAAYPRSTQAVGQVVAQQDISNTPGQSEVPEIGFGGGRLSAVWGERPDDSLGFNTTALDAAWPDASILNTGTKVQYQWPDIVVDDAGTSHIVYAIGDQVFYGSRTATSNTWSKHLVANSSFPNPTRIARGPGPNGTLWIVWRDANGTGIFYQFSKDGGVNWYNGSDGGVVFQGPGNLFAPDIAVDQNDNPHVVWYTRSSGADKGEISYGDWTGSRFTANNITNDGSTFYDADPLIAVDGTNVQHVVWRKSVGNDWEITYARRPSGGDWQDYTPLASTNGDAKYAPSIGTDAAGRVYVAYSDPTSASSRQIAFLSKTAGSWDGPRALTTGRWDSHSAVTGSAAPSAEAHILYQHESGSDDGRIIYIRMQFTTPIEAVPHIEADAPFTNKQNTVNVTFTGVSGSPTQVRYRWGSPPTDANPWQTLPSSGPLVVPVPTDLSQSACNLRTLFTQVRSSSATQTTPRSDSITFDLDVQAAVLAVNPHMAGLPPLYTSGSVGINDLLAQGGASDGAPNYSRDHAFFLGVTDFSECVGLKDVTVTGGLPTTAVPAGGYKNTVPLPGDMTIGPKRFDIIVTDKITPTPNTKSYQATIIYDPSDTDPSPTTNNTDGLPVLAGGGSVTGDSNTGSVLRTLTFRDISVNDNLYGKQGENLPSGRQFWGVWVANVPESADKGPDDSNLRWFPVRVPDPGPSFSIEWSLFTGLNYGMDTTKPGNYVVYVRFLDGAGNPSAGSLKTTLTLDPGYAFPSRWLPLIGK